MRYKQILFYYSVLVATLFLVGIVLFLPRPESFIPLFIFFPIPLHLWLNINETGRKAHIITEETNKSAIHRKNRAAFLAIIILLTLIISSVSIFIYSVMLDRFSQTRNFSKSETEIKNISKRLKTVTDKISGLELSIDDFSRILSNNNNSQKNTKSLDISDTNNTSTSSGLIKIVSQQTVDVYKESTPESEVIGKTVYNQIYTYNKKIPGWYLIILPGLEQGWIKAQFGKEI